MSRGHARTFPRHLVVLASAAVLLAACVPPWTPPDSPPTVQRRAVLFVNGAHDGPDNFHTIQTVLRGSDAWSGRPCDPGRSPEENEGCFLVVPSGAIPDPDRPQETRCLPEIVDDVAAEIDSWVAHFDGPVDLVGYSLGGVIVRDYVQHRGGAGKVDDVVALGAPLQGTDWLYHEGVGAENCMPHDLSPESEYVTTNFPDASVPGTPAASWTSVYALGDEAISDCPGVFPAPGENCPYDPVLEGAGVANRGIEVEGWKHLTISTDPEAVAAVADALYDSSS